jgi:hypothetical protein
MERLPVRLFLTFISTSYLATPQICLIRAEVFGG